jgi:CBS-domain-containing membrane protein
VVAQITNLKIGEFEGKVMRAVDIMRRRVLTVSPDTGIHEVAKKLADYGVSAMPVVDKERHVLGMISEGDLMRRPEMGTQRHPSWWLRFLSDPVGKAHEYVKTHGQYAKDVMTKDVITVSEQTPLIEIADLLEKHRIKRVPVVRDSKLVGIVSRANLMHGLIAQKKGTSALSADLDIKHAILKEVEEAGVRHEFVDVVVAQGIAHLWGAVYSDKEKDAVRAAAEAIPDVKAVVNHVSVMPQLVRATVGSE